MKHAEIEADMNKAHPNPDYKKSGYLHSDYRLFHLKDTALKTFDFHYHDFHKILIFLNGNADYIIEGRQYDLQPFDILLIPAGEIHKPIVHGNATYERIIFYISPDFFTENSTADANLFECFETAVMRDSNLIRLKDRESGYTDDSSLTSFINRLTLLPLSSDARTGDASLFGADLHIKLKVLEFLILLNRTTLAAKVDFSNPVTRHPAVLSIMEYINNHIAEELSIDNIADAMFLNRSYIMHLFKAETGYTIGQYITKKRLFLTNQYRSQGLSLTESCFKSGFRNYSAYYHARRKK